MSDIKTKPSTKEYREGYENIRWKKFVHEIIESLPAQRRKRIEERAKKLIENEKKSNQ